MVIIIILFFTCYINMILLFIVLLNVFHLNLQRVQVFYYRYKFDAIGTIGKF